jgi:hypothetical protein
VTEEHNPSTDTPINETPAPQIEQEAAPSLSPQTAPIWRKWLVQLIPHLVTALISVALTLAIISFQPEPEPSIQPIVRPTSAPTQALAPTVVTVTRTPQLQPDERVLSQELLDLQIRVDELWSGVYIARAATQLVDAESALRLNDTSEVERILVVVDASLALAYERSGDLNKGPISEFRSQVSQIRDDLYIRPEGIDQKLKVLRQRMVSLVEEP